MAKITFLFLVVWFGCYILYPGWLLPLPPWERLLVYLLFILFFSLNGWLLFHWIKGKVEWSPVLPTATVILEKVRENLVLFLAILLYAGLHIYPMTLPITTGGDEDVHSIASLAILKNIGTYSQRFLGLSSYALVRLVTLVSIVILILFILFKKRLNGMLAKDGRRLLILGVPLILFFLGVFFYLLRSQPFHQAILRFPPLERIATIIPYSLFGIHEFVARLPSLIFSLLSAVYLFKLVGLYRDKWTAALASILFIFIPTYFFYGSLAYPETGGMLFLLLASFYFLRHVQTLSHKDLLFCFLFAGMGFLYRRPLIALFGVFWIYWFLARVRGEKYLGWSTYLKYTWIGLVPVIPYLIVLRLYSNVQYLFAPSNWRSLEIVIRYLRYMPGQVTVPLFLVFIVGLIWGLWKRRDSLTVYFLILFTVYYLFWTTERIIDPVANARYMVMLLPLVVVLSASFLGDLRKNLGLKRLASGLAVLVVGFLIYKAPLNPTEVPFKYGGQIYISFDEIYDYFKDNLKSRQKVGFISPISTAVGFYRYKFGLEHKLDFVFLSEDALLSSEATRRYFKKENIRYLLVFYPKNYPFSPLDVYKRLENFVDSSENIFIEVRKSVEPHGVLWLGKLKEPELR